LPRKRYDTYKTVLFDIYFVMASEGYVEMFEKCRSVVEDYFDSGVLELMMERAETGAYDDLSVSEQENFVYDLSSSGYTSRMDFNTLLDVLTRETDAVETTGEAGDPMYVSEVDVLSLLTPESAELDGSGGGELSAAGD
jgi:hypothetical protein